MTNNTMQVFQHAPIPVLRPFIKRFLVVEFPTLHHDTHLPDTCPVAAFSFRGSCRIDDEGIAPPAAFTGIRGALRAHEHTAGHSVVIATFTPVGAAAFLNSSLEEFTGTTADLARILDCSTDLKKLHEQLSEAPNHGQRIGLLETFLLTRIRISEPDPLVDAATSWLEQEVGNSRIDTLTRYIGLSQSALERRFKRVVGVSPKTFASIVRLKRAVRLRMKGTDLADVAQAAGYFDQSHFIKDFRRATGSTPESYFRQIATR